MSQSSWKALPGYSASSFACALLLACGALRGQTMMVGATPGAEVHIFNTDSAILEAQETRKDLPCTATPVKPALGFRPQVSRRLRSQHPAEGTCGRAESAYHDLPRHAGNSSGRSGLHVAADQRSLNRGQRQGRRLPARHAWIVGEGKYHVDWLMRDRTERVCSSYWDIDANLPPKDKQVALEIRPGEVRATDTGTV